MSDIRLESLARLKRGVRASPHTEVGIVDLGMGDCSYVLLRVRDSIILTLEQRLKHA